MMAALPWVLLGLAVALCAAGYAAEKEQDGRKRWKPILVGLGIGMLLGVVLSLCGLFENLAPGVSLGALLGLVVGINVKSKR